MGQYYSKLQGKYLAVKSKMVEVLERQDSTEATTRDFKHVRFFLLGYELAGVL